jgi:hypothetical protein
LWDFQWCHLNSKGSLQDLSSDVIGSLGIGGFSCLCMPDLYLGIAALHWNTSIIGCE